MADAGMPGTARAAGQPGRSASRPRRSRTPPDWSAIRGTAASASAAEGTGAPPAAGQAQPGSGAGYRLPAGRPVSKAMGQLGDMNGVAAVRQQRPDSVADPDHAMGSGRSDARQQPRPPGSQHRAPWLPCHLAPEVGGPVGDPARIAQRLLPVLADRGAAARELLQPSHVPVKPAVHASGVPVANHGLGCHRAMVGQPPVELRSRGVQPLVGLVQCPRRVGCHHCPPSERAATFSAFCPVSLPAARRSRQRGMTERSPPARSACPEHQNCAWDGCACAARRGRRESVSGRCAGRRRSLRGRPWGACRRRWTHPSPARSSAG